MSSAFLAVLLLIGSVFLAEPPVPEPASCSHELHLIIGRPSRRCMDAGDAYHHILDVSNARCMSCGEDPIQVAEITDTVPHVWTSNGYDCAENMHTVRQICTPCGHETSYTVPCTGVHEDIIDPTRIILPEGE